MPLIQRNLFPRRPPKAKCDGPSVLKPSASNSISLKKPSIVLQQTLQDKPEKAKTAKKVESNNKKSKLYKSKSASLNSLVVISQQQNGTQQGPSTKNVSKNSNYDGSHDSFQCTSTDSSSDPSHSLSSSCGSVDQMMISRRRIVCRSRDALNQQSSSNTNSDDYLSSEAPDTSAQNIDQDVWFNKHKLVEEHVEEIVSKWDQIDDEIWAKVICMERNRRVAKAYARSPILTVNGCDIGFDGHRIGLNGFNNPIRDKKVAEIKKNVDCGVKIRMDEHGNLLVKRLTKCEVHVLELEEEKRPVRLDTRKSATLFDMAKFQSELVREIKCVSSGNARALQHKCFCLLSFGKLCHELLNTPVWIIVINLVALEMVLKLMPTKILDDNFYSLPITMQRNANRSSAQRFSSPTPPKLPPRDLHNKKAPLTLPEPDYDNESARSGESPARSLDDMADLMYHHRSRNPAYIDDDPYFFGMSAHVPKSMHPTGSNNTDTTSSRHNPPIMRKKFWSQSSNNFKFFGGNNSNSHKAAKSNQTKSSTLDFRGNNNSNGYSGSTSGYYSNFSLLQAQYCIPVATHAHEDARMLSHAQQTMLANDNNEIYGVNTSLLRKNSHQQLLKHHKRSVSSPSLKNIFSRSNKVKDINNNKVGNKF